MFVMPSLVGRNSQSASFPDPSLSLNRNPGVGMMTENQVGIVELDKIQEVRDYRPPYISSAIEGSPATWISRLVNGTAKSGEKRDSSRCPMERYHAPPCTSDPAEH